MSPALGLSSVILQSPMTVLEVVDVSPINNPMVTQGGIVQWIIPLFLSDLLGLAPCSAVAVGDELLNFLTGDIFALAGCCTQACSLVFQ